MMEFVRRSGAGSLKICRGKGEKGESRKMETAESGPWQPPKDCILLILPAALKF
jgi:hypothetical protein